MSECVYILFLPVSPFSSRVAIVSLEIIIGPFVAMIQKLSWALFPLRTCHEEYGGCFVVTYFIIFFHTLVKRLNSSA